MRIAARNRAPIHIKTKKDPDMRHHRILLALVLAIGGTQAALAEEYRGTWEQQMACTPDVWRLCSDQIPDVNRIVACLQQNTPKSVQRLSRSVPVQQQRAAVAGCSTSGTAWPRRTANSARSAAAILAYRTAAGRD